MITYADLLYDAAAMMLAEAAHLDQEPTKPARPRVDGAIRRLREEAEMIHAQLRESTENGALSPEEISRIEKAYDSTGSAWGDVRKLIKSNEALRQQAQVVKSIAWRYATGWVAGSKSSWYGFGGVIEPMTPSQIEWFEAHA
jgi:hypothetical protein